MVRQFIYLVFCSIFILQNNIFSAQSDVSLHADLQSDVVQTVVTLTYLDEFDELITRTGVLVSPSGVILTEFDEIDLAEMAGFNYRCEDSDRDIVEVRRFETEDRYADDTYTACLIDGNFEHGFALLQIEDADNDLPFATVIDEGYSRIGDSFTAIFPLEGELVLTDTAIGAIPLVPDESGRQLRHYITDLQEITSEGIGSPLFDAEGRVVGIVYIIEEEQVGTSQLSYVVPITSVCSIAVDLCEAYLPDDKMIPDNREDVPDNAILLDEDLIDWEAEVEKLCAIPLGLTSSINEDSESGWECLSDDTPIEDVTIAELDDICKFVYSDFDAFALITGDESDTLAHRWQCHTFEY
jgi:hypothetical protein